MAQSVKFQLCKHEDLSLDPPHPGKGQGWWLTCNPVLEVGQTQVGSWSLLASCTHMCIHNEP